jgi:hypothetical protein
MSFADFAHCAIVIRILRDLPLCAEYRSTPLSGKTTVQIGPILASEKTAMALHCAKI